MFSLEIVDKVKLKGSLCILNEYYTEAVLG